MILDSMILEKKIVRSDSLWTNRLVYSSALSRIPLFMDTLVLMRSQYWPRNVLREYQKHRIQTLLEESRRVPFWDDVLRGVPVEVDADVFSMLAALPVISKKELSEAAQDKILDPSLIAKSDADHTSGSTGRPFHFRMDWHSSLRSFAVTERIFRTAGRGVRYPIVYMRARERNGFTFVNHEWFFLKGYLGVRHRIDEFKKLAEKYPDGFILYGYTSAMVEVARQLRINEVSLPLKAVMAAGENLSESDRAFMEEVFGCDVYTLYASREAGFLGFECEEHRMHISEEWAFLQIVDDAGRALEDGAEGRIIVTAFDNRIMPFIRYDIGDRGAISDAPCSCGRTLRTISFRGRSAEVLDLPEGRQVSLLEISTTLDLFWNAIRQFQIVQKATDRVVLRVVPHTDFDIARSGIEATLKRLLHPSVRIEWEVMEEIPEAKSGKAVYYIKDYA
jgi:phenylacetate-CoA ligase